MCKAKNHSILASTKDLYCIVKRFPLRFELRITRACKTDFEKSRARPDFFHARARLFCDLALVSFVVSALLDFEAVWPWNVGIFDQTTLFATK